jgi:hypothetical protein
MIGVLIMCVFLIRIAFALLSYVDLTAWKYNFKPKTKYVAGLFVNNFIDSRVLFVLRYKQLPSVSVITQVDVTKAYAFINKKLKTDIKEIHQANMYEHCDGKTHFSVTILELSKKRMIEIGNGYVEVMYTLDDFDWMQAMMRDLSAFKVETHVVEEKAPTIIGFARAMEMN